MSSQTAVDGLRSRPVKSVPGPNGRLITMDDLPPPETERWVTRRKAEVVAAVRGGLIDLQQACARYRLSEDEFRSWERLIDAHGVRGLRVTRLKDYRDATLSIDEMHGALR
ncbi:MAG TPA: DUF1153 domain-containing protein [Azospirillaceae bacterium]|nr:DUF1153 domain-containing protein [Azospirillaceae bacterium]